MKKLLLALMFSPFMLFSQDIRYPIRLPLIVYEENTDTKSDTVKVYYDYGRYGSMRTKYGYAVKMGDKILLLNEKKKRIKRYAKVYRVVEL